MVSTTPKWGTGTCTYALEIMWDVELVVRDLREHEKENVCWPACCYVVCNHLCVFNTEITWYKHSQGLHPLGLQCFAR